MADKLSLGELRILGLAALGGALEFYDFIVFVYLANVFSQVFFPPGIQEWLKQLQTFGIFAIGFLARPLGGILMGYLGDRLGRKKIFMFSFGMISFSTLGIGLLPTYKVAGAAAPIFLLIFRLLQGCAIGGEVPGAWVFVAEHVPSHRIGFACSCVSAGLNFGILIGSLVVAVINLMFGWSEIVSYLWRVPFIVGGLFGVFSACLRRWLHETPIFLEMQKNKKIANDLSVKVILRDYQEAIKTVVFFTLLLSVFIVVIVLMTPSLLQTYFFLHPKEILFAANLSNCSLVIGSLLAGYFVDKIGPKKTIRRGIVVVGFTYFLLFLSASMNKPLLIYLFYILTGLFVGVVAAMPFVFIHAFPAKIRLTGISCSYNLSYAIFAGLIPFFISPLVALHRLGPVFFVCLICVVGSVYCSNFTQHLDTLSSKHQE